MHFGVLVWCGLRFSESKHPKLWKTFELVKLNEQIGRGIQGELVQVSLERETKEDYF